MFYRYCTCADTAITYPDSLKLLIACAETWVWQKCQDDGSIDIMQSFPISQDREVSQEDQM